MSRKYDLVIFDWDGTLMDSIGSIVSCMQAASNDARITIPSEQAIRDLIGLSLPKMFNILFGEHPHLHDEILNLYRHHYLSGNYSSALFDGSESLLKKLKHEGYTLAIATGKNRQGLDRILDLTGVGHYFSATRCADETESKPDPLMLNSLLTELAFTPAKTVMIGDSIHDLNMANNAGVDCIGVSYGANHISQLQFAKPIAIVDSVTDLAFHL